MQTLLSSSLGTAAAASASLVSNHNPTTTTELDYAAIAVGTNSGTYTKCATITISSAITCSGGKYPEEVGASPAPMVRPTKLGGGTDYTSSSPLTVAIGTTCTLDMKQQLALRTVGMGLSGRRSALDRGGN